MFHKGGARLILCGKNWEKLEELADDLANASDPTVVSAPALKLNQSPLMVGLVEHLMDHINTTYLHW